MLRINDISCSQRLEAVYGMALLVFFANNSEDRQFITKHNLDPAMLKKLSMFPDNRHEPIIILRIYVVAWRIGRVLLNFHGSAHQIYAWDPIRDIQKGIGAPKKISCHKAASGTILCSGNQEGGLCPHYCHSSNLWIILITTDPLLTKAQRYSSEL
jgi:hypothetical protein